MLSIFNRSFKSEWCTNWYSHCTLLCVVYMFVPRFHLNDHTVRFYPPAQKLELHSKQIAVGESIAEDSFKWSHHRISSTNSNVRVANYLITLSLGVKWLRFERCGFFFAIPSQSLLLLKKILCLTVKLNIPSHQQMRWRKEMKEQLPQKQRQNYKILNQ